MNYSLNFVNLPAEGGIDIKGVKSAYYLEVEKVTNISIQDETVMMITRLNDEKYKSIENINYVGHYSMIIKDESDTYWLLRDCDFTINSGMLTINEYSTVFPTKLYYALPYLVIE